MLKRKYRRFPLDQSSSLWVDLNPGTTESETAGPVFGLEGGCKANASDGNLTQQKA